MPNNLEIIERSIHDFQRVQRRMLLAKDVAHENAVKTYADLKEEYTSLKALLGTAGVNLTELDKIKE